MERRNFLKNTYASAVFPLGLGSGLLSNRQEELAGRELFELRTYEMKFRADSSVLVNYLKTVLRPALTHIGSTGFYVFNEYGKSEPRKVHVLIGYSNPSSFVEAQFIRFDPGFLKNAKSYNSIPPDKALYHRYSSSLMTAFAGMPKIGSIEDKAKLFELRIYEGYSEDAVRRKIQMFDVEEIDLFVRLGLTPIFFGDMVIGPYRPCLAYMLAFKDMNERNARWKTFADHPDWHTMRVKTEYANTVSNIRKTFLTLG